MNAALFSPQGAFTDLDELVALHRLGRGMRLGRARRTRARAGEWKTRQRGRGVDFEEVRLYQPGDDIRAIDWRVTARSQHPHTKVYQEERERPVMLAADLRSPMFFGGHCFKSVYGAALLSALAWIALGNRDRVGGLVFGDRAHRDIRPRRSKHAVLEWIGEAHRFCRQLQTPCPAQAPQPLSRLLEHLQRTCRPGTAIYITSDFHDLDENSHQLLHQLARHNDLTLCLLVDPLETAPLSQAGLWVTDGRRQWSLPKGRALAPELESRIQRLADWCAPLGIDLARLQTDTPLPGALARLCRKGGGR